MMGKTHVFMGVATSILVFHPTDGKSLLMSIAGGALGGVAADIDTVKDDYKCDALIGQLLAIGIAGISLLIDYLMKLGIIIDILQRNRILVIAGLIAYVVLLIIGFATDHRTFTHSFLSVILFSIAVLLIYPMMAIPYAIGYLSHLVLDIMNKKPVPLLFPKEDGVCLGLCYASKTANACFMVFGLIASVFLIFNTLFFHLF